MAQPENALGKTMKTNYKDTGVRYNKTVMAVGRNGNSKCIGLNMFRYNDIVHINPVNSRVEETNCMVQVPVESVKDLIAALQLMLEE